MTPLLVARTNLTSEATELWSEAVRLYPELPRVTARFFADYFRRFGRDFPWRRIQDPYFILVAEIMLQKTHSRAVSAVWSEFTQRWPTPEKLARAHIKTLEKMLRPLGLRKRAPRMRELAKTIVETGHRVLTNYAGLTSLPGVGKYTANSVLCQAYGRQVPMVDINAARVYCRAYGIGLKTLRQALGFADYAAEAAISLAPAREVNLGVFDFAQTTCRIAPRCFECGLRSFCEYAKAEFDFSDQTMRRAS